MSERQIRESSKPFFSFFLYFFLCHLPANHIIGIEIRGDIINDLLLLAFPGSSKLTFSMKKSKNFFKKCRQVTDQKEDVDRKDSWEIVDKLYRFWLLLTL